MDSRELAELQRHMKKASEAGLMDGAKTQGGGKAQSNSSPATVKGGAMTDACKRRKKEPEELSSDSVIPLDDLRIVRPLTTRPGM